MQTNIIGYTASLLWMSWAGFALKNTDLWSIAVKSGAVVTFILASIHMVSKIQGQWLDNRIKREELGDD